MNPLQMLFYGLAIGAGVLALGVAIVLSLAFYFWLIAPERRH